jgi:hypothetical protein
MYAPLSTFRLFLLALTTAAPLATGGCPPADTLLTADAIGTTNSSPSLAETDRTSTADDLADPVTTVTYAIVDTGQVTCFDNTGVITAPNPGDPFYGQDASYTGNPPSYTDNNDGTVTDNVTGLMWQQSFTVVPYADAQATAAAATTAGYTDWRVPTIQELYSLIDFTGNQGTGPPNSATPPDDAVPFINDVVFDFEYPSFNRYIDAQYISSTEYTSTTMNGNATFFGVNFADGRIKGYPQVNPHRPGYYLRLVRGNAYGANDFVDNRDGTVTDHASGLMWMQVDSGADELAAEVAGYTYADGSLTWQEALDFAENVTYAGHDDWRLPNAKELHSLLDYTRSPDGTGSPAIVPLFDCAPIFNEAGEDDYPFYWSSTTFEPGFDAIYIAFGRGLGYMDFGGGAQFYDVHGAGCQRTDPKLGTPSYGFGPQGDVRRVYNHVRCVRDAQ